MALPTIPKKIKFKLFFLFFVSVVTMVNNAYVEMVIETLIFDIIDLTFESKEPLTPSLKSQSLVANKKKCDHESTWHFKDQWAMKLPWT
jgi:hypothetical protein